MVKEGIILQYIVSFKGMEGTWATKGQEAVHGVLY